MTPATLHWRLSAILALTLTIAGCVSTPGREKPLEGVISTAFSPDGQWVAGATAEGEVALFRAQPLRFEKLLTAAEDRVPLPRTFDVDKIVTTLFKRRPTAFSRDGVRLAGMARSDVVIWAVDDGRVLCRLPAGDAVSDIAFSPDDRILVTAGPRITFWSVSDCSRAGSIEPEANVAATAVAFSPDGQVLTVGLSSGQIAQYDAKRQALLRVGKEHEAPVHGLAYRGDGTLFASSAGGCDVRLWRHADSGATSEAQVAPSAGADSGGGDAKPLSYWLLRTPEGMSIAQPLWSGSQVPGGLRPSGRDINRLCGSRVAFSADGRVFAATFNACFLDTDQFTLAVRNLRSGATGFPATGLLQISGCDVSLSPDGQTVVAGGPAAPRLFRTGDIVPGLR